MSPYTISLFLHILGALALFALLGLEWAGLHYVRRAAEAGQAREWARLLAAPRAAGPAALLLLATGIHMSATRWGPRGWIIVALGAVVAVAALGAALGGRRLGVIAGMLAAERGPVSAALRRRLEDPALALSLRLRTALLVGIVFLMATKPGWAGALAAMGVAAAAGLAGAVPALGGGRRQSRVAAESEP